MRNKVGTGACTTGDKRAGKSARSGNEASEQAVPYSHPRLIGAGLGAGGLLLIGIGVGAVYWMTTLVHGARPDDPSTLEYLLAVTAFSGMTFGAGLLVLGADITTPRRFQRAESPSSDRI